MSETKPDVSGMSRRRFLQAAAALSAGLLAAACGNGTDVIPTPTTAPKPTQPIPLTPKPPELLPTATPIIKDKESTPESEFSPETTKLIAMYSEFYPDAKIDTILKYAKIWNVKPEYILSLMTQESLFRPKVESKAGAQGLMQVIPTTGTADLKEIIKLWGKSPDGKTQFESLTSSPLSNADWQKLAVAKTPVNYDQVCLELAQKYLDLKNPEQAIAIGSFHLAKLMEHPVISKLPEAERFKFAAAIYNKGHVPLAALNVFNADQDNNERLVKAGGVPFVRKPVTWDNTASFLDAITNHPLREYGIPSDYIPSPASIAEVKSYVNLVTRWLNEYEAIKINIGNKTFAQTNIERLPGPLVLFDNQRPVDSLRTMFETYNNFESDIVFYEMTPNLPPSVKNLIEGWKKKGIKKIGIAQVQEMGKLLQTDTQSPYEVVTSAEQPIVEICRQPSGIIRIEGDHFVDDGGQIFLRGVNYEGPSDRQWQMWDEGKFDPNLIEQDLQRAKEAGFFSLRIFISKSLDQSIEKGDFSKLDTLLALAKKHNLRLLITLNDAGNLDLERVAGINGMIAQRYRNNEIILGYDLRNEPKLVDIAGASFPKGIPVPLQTDFVVKQYGELATREAALKTQREKPWAVPKHLTPDQAYYYYNSYQWYLRFLSEAGVWTSKNNAPATDYLKSKEGQKWQPFWNAFDQTLETWIDLQSQPIRKIGPQKPITVGHNISWHATSPGNRSLSFVSFHSYPETEGLSAVKAIVPSLNTIRNRNPGKPITLGKFGFASAQQKPGVKYDANNPKASQIEISETTTASQTMSAWLKLLEGRFAGGWQWQLGDNFAAWDPKESSFGLFRKDGSPKTAVVSAIKGVFAIATKTDGQFKPLMNEINQPGSAREGIIVNYVDGNALVTSSAEIKDGLVRVTQKENVRGVGCPLTVISGIEKDGVANIYLLSGGNMQISLDIQGLYPEFAGKKVKVQAYREDEKNNKRSPVTYTQKDNLVDFSVGENGRYIVIINKIFQVET